MVKHKTLSDSQKSFSVERSLHSIPLSEYQPLLEIFFAAQLPTHLDTSFKKYSQWESNKSFQNNWTPVQQRQLKKQLVEFLFAHHFPKHNLSACEYAIIDIWGLFSYLKFSYQSENVDNSTSARTLRRNLKWQVYQLEKSNHQQFREQDDLKILPSFVTSTLEHSLSRHFQYFSVYSDIWNKLLWIRIEQFQSPVFERKHSGSFSYYSSLSFSQKQQKTPINIENWSIGQHTFYIVYCFQSNVLLVNRSPQSKFFDKCLMPLLVPIFNCSNFTKKPLISPDVKSLWDIVLDSKSRGINIRLESSLQGDYSTHLFTPDPSKLPKDDMNPLEHISTEFTIRSNFGDKAPPLLEKIKFNISSCWYPNPPDSVQKDPTTMKSAQKHPKNSSLCTPQGVGTVFPLTVTFSGSNVLAGLKSSISTKFTNYPLCPPLKNVIKNPLSKNSFDHLDFFADYPPEDD